MFFSRSMLIRWIRGSFIRLVVFFFLVVWNRLMFRFFVLKLLVQFSGCFVLMQWWMWFLSRWWKCMVNGMYVIWMCWLVLLRRVSLVRKVMFLLLVFCSCWMVCLGVCGLLRMLLLSMVIWLELIIRCCGQCLVSVLVLLVERWCISFLVFFLV